MFRPLSKVVGGVAALLLTFFLSGIIHDIVISIPAGGGYGWPTVYFTLQGIGVLAERSRVGQRLRRAHPGLARVFTLTILLAPVGLLFPPIFVTRIMVPFLHFIGALP
jgi:alginate O-acetyltransferase complex protein AlgI